MLLSDWLILMISNMYEKLRASSFVAYDYVQSLGSCRAVSQ